MEKSIRFAFQMIKAGRKREEILKYVNEEIFEIAYARYLAMNKISFYDKIYSDIEGIKRYATYEDVAKYKAKRLKCNVLADLGCGVGIQLIFFAKECEFVYGVEINERRYKYCIKNLRKLGIKNFEIIHGDALSKEVYERIKNVDIIFSDPSREIKEEIDLKYLSPNPLKIYEMYKNKTDNFAFDLPVQIKKEKIPFDCELEYQAYYKEPFRATAYLGELKKCEKSVVLLPYNIRLEYNENIDRNIKFTDKVCKYLYLLNRTINLADLVPEAIEYLRKNGDVKIIYRDKRRCLLTSDDYFETNISECYEVLSKCKEGEIRDSLEKVNAKKVYLRFEIDPKKYYEVKRSLERGLKGKEKIYVFKIRDEYILTKKLY